jgi:tRNA modification GTPase
LWNNTHTIEDELVIGGIGFRFIDTAGIRETQDVVESIGIRKAFEKIEQSGGLYLKSKIQSSKF